MANCIACSYPAYYVGFNSCECSNPKCKWYTKQEVQSGKKIATRIRSLPQSLTGAKQVLYRMDPPHCGATHIVSSAIDCYSGPETLLFASDAEGVVLCYGDLDGSSRGHMDNDRAIRDAGYEVLSVPYDEQIADVLGQEAADLFISARKKLGI